MNKINTIIYLALIIGSLVPKMLHAQSYKKFSNYAGGSGIDEVNKLQVVNGETYLLGYTKSANFPVTNGSTYKGLTDITLTKYGVNGNVLYATYLGGIYNETATAMQVINGEVFLTGYTESPNYPATNGSVFSGGLQDVFVTKLTLSGTIAFSTFLGGIKNETPNANILQVSGNDLVITGTTGSANFPVTNGSIYGGGISDVFVTKLNAVNGNILSSALFGGNNTDYMVKTEFENNDVYLIGSTVSLDIPTTIGSPVNDTLPNGFIIKINRTNFSTLYARYLGSFGTDYINASQLVNGILHVCGHTYSLSFPVTNTTSPDFSGLDFADGFYTKLDNTGNIIFSTYLSTNELDIFDDIIVTGGDTYLMAGKAFSPANGEKKLIIFKMNAAGDFIYTKKFGLGFGNPAGPGPGNPGFLSYKVLNGDFYTAGICQTAGFPVTNGSQFFSGGSGFFTHLDASGNTLFSTFLGKMNSLLPMKLSNSKFYLLGNTDLASYPMTDLSLPAGNNDNVLIIKDANGSDVFSGYVGGSDAELAAAVETAGEDVYFGGKTSSINYPVTNNTLYNGNGDQFVTRLSFCPLNYFVTDDTLSPLIQTACKFGLAQKITGVHIIVPADSMPLLYLNGIPTEQTPLTATYQWQTATAPGGPWTNIPAAVFKDYTPILGASDQYFRRLSFTLPQCGNTLIHISNTATVFANSLTAPVINAGGPFITCPGSPVTIGGTPTVTGGNPPYITYSWDPIADPVPNPTVTVNSNSIFTLIVTDNAGCQQIGQSVVLAYRAGAGPDRGACGGIAVQIGTPPVPVPGIVYSWQPGTALNATNVAQPFANPAVITNYELILTVPKSGGGTCITKDTVKVTPVAAPITQNIAGPDRVICLNDSTSLGTSAEAGFNYVWSPGSYITSNTTSITYYYPGNIIMPEPNPATLYLTAQKNGCSFPDETVVATIEARGGFDGCGPRIIGLPDRTPDINETYSWSIISGPGTFTGPTDQPQVPVSASVGGTTIYGLTVSYNGHSCFDQVRISSNCSGCLTEIEVDAQYTCPDYNSNGGDVTLTAFSSLFNAIYTWQPQVGLTNYTGSVVHLTDDVPRTYIVTATDANDSTIQCSNAIFVNDPAFSTPVFPASDTIACIGVPITIGAPPVAGYSYTWSGPGLSSNLVSNPVATVTTQTSYPVLVQDGNGCELRDTILVSVQNSQVNGGPDWLICSNGIILLGTPAQPNTTYLWEPQTSPWQNGTSQFSAQPQVFIATDIDFIVTAITSAGCITKDTVHVVLNNNPGIPDAPDTFICKGTPVQIGSPAQGGVVYQWAPAAGLSNPNIAQPIANPTVTTTYTLTATFQGSCVINSSDQVTVTVGDPTFSMPDILFCPDNGAIALGNAAPPGMFSYSWTPTQLVTNATIANPSTLSPPPSITTQFTLLVTTADGCKYRDTMLIVPAVVKPDAGPDKIICKFHTTAIGSPGNPVGPGIIYNWTPATNLDNPNSPNPIFTGTTGGTFTYILTISNSIISCSSADTVVIKVIDISFPLLNNPTVCQNSCIQIGTTPVPGIQYQWSPQAGLSDPFIANPLACVGSSTLSYTLTATDLYDCMSSATTVIGVFPLPAAQATIPTVNACLGDVNAMFNPSINPPGNYAYTWTPDNGTLSDIHVLNPGIILTGVGSSQYLLQITDTSTGCSNIAVGTVVVSLCPDLAIIGDYMWFDTNSDGIQDPDELGVSGMEVKLYNSAGFNVATTTTDPNGFYQFVNVQPGNDYYVIFSLPAGYMFTTQNVGGFAATNNSKPDATGRTDNFNVPANASILNIDAGIKTCIVPISLLNFTARLHNRQVLLNWQTTAEFNNDYFDVERSRDGNSFNAIGRVNGNGTTSLPHSYSLIDPHPFIGLNFYRLRQVDFDGQFTYSHVEVVELKNNEIVTAYYNNQSNSIQLAFNSQQANLRVKLYAANGQLIKSAAAANNINSYSFELPAITTGIYMLQVMSGKVVYSKKIFINK